VAQGEGPEFKPQYHKKKKKDFSGRTDPSSSHGTATGKNWGSEGWNEKFTIFFSVFFCIIHELHPLHLLAVWCCTLHTWLPMYFITKQPSEEFSLHIKQVWDSGENTEVGYLRLGPQTYRLPFSGRVSQASLWVNPKPENEHDSHGPEVPAIHSNGTIVSK
jgi:hypothetical protein